MKAIRIPSIARKVLNAGAVGVTCAKVSQAIVLVQGGVKDILIANEVVSHAKIEVLVALGKLVDRICVACDDTENIRLISKLSSAAGVTIGVLVDVDCGMHRCGVPWEQLDLIVSLSRLAIELPGIEYKGIMAYDGHNQALLEKFERHSAFAANVMVVREALLAAGVNVPLCSGSGSGNYYIAAKLGSITEVQAGGGLLCCRTYQGYNDLDIAPPMQTALFLRARIISVAGVLANNQLIGDAGFKSGFPITGTLPTVISHPGLKVKALNAEHTIFEITGDGAIPKLGDCITMVPAYSDSTTLLHRRIYGVRGGVIEEVYDMRLT